MSCDDKHGGHGDFFAVDRRAWAKACSVGLNAAIAYLVLARGTGGDNRTTAWSTNAIEQRTGMGRHRAKDAVKALIDSGLVRLDKGGARPRYYLQPAHEVAGCSGAPPEKQDSYEATIYRAIANGSTIVKRGDRSFALSLARKGWIREGNDGRFHVVTYDPDTAARPDWIWLPNTLVDAAADEPPPIELVRQSQTLPALRLLVDLYHAQGLALDGGVHWRQLREKYERHKVGQRGPYIVWGFRAGSQTAWPTAPFVASMLTGRMEAADGTQRDTGWSIFWDALSVLQKTGLVEYVGHVVDADTDEAAVIHPYGLGAGESGEQAIAHAAHRAGHALLTEAQSIWVDENGLWLLPARAHLANVQLVGLARLRYRARTTATAAWYGGAAEWETWADRYEALRAEATGEAVSTAHATSRGNQREVKGVSTGGQG